eukprot:Clim_evm6s209 gene=Clim_evmTU6s209
MPKPRGGGRGGRGGGRGPSRGGSRASGRGGRGGSRASGRGGRGGGRGGRGGSRASGRGGRGGSRASGRGGHGGGRGGLKGRSGSSVGGPQKPSMNGTTSTGGYAKKQTNFTNKRKADGGPSAPFKKQKPDGEGKEQPALRRERAGGYERVEKLKKMWEKIRSDRDATKKDVHEAVREMCEEMQGHVEEIVFKHDGSRIVQYCVKEATEEQRGLIIKELKGHMQDMASKTKYGKYCLMKIITACSKAQRLEAINELIPHTRKLLASKEASEVMELAYHHGTAKEKHSMLRTLYGPHFSVLMQGQSENAAPSLEQALKEQPDMAKSIVQGLISTLKTIVEKNGVQRQVVHVLALDLIKHARDGNERDAVVDILAEVVPEFLHTRNGMETAIRLIARSNAKERKAIIKACKDFIGRIATNEYGCFVLMCLCEQVDDTVLLEKSVLKPLLALAEETMTDRYYCYVLLELLNPRCTKLGYLPKVHVDTLAVADGNPNSKKDAEKRRSEVLTVVKKFLPKTLLTSGFPEEWLKEMHCRNVVVECMRNAMVATSELREKFAVRAASLVRSPVFADLSRGLKMLIKEEGSDFDPCFADLLLEPLQAQSGEDIFVEMATKSAPHALVCVALVEQDSSKKASGAVKKSLKAVKASDIPKSVQGTVTKAIKA